MDGSNKRELEENNETSARKRQTCEDEENRRQHTNGPQSSNFLTTRRLKYIPRVYYNDVSGSLDEAKRRDRYRMESTRQSTNQQPGGVSPRQDEFQSLKECFIYLLSERLPRLGEEYDPEVASNPLSDEEIEVMREDLSNYVAHEQNEAKTIFEEWSKDAKEFIERELFPYIDQNMDHTNFCRIFTRIRNVLFQIRFYLDKVLLSFDFADYWGESISEECINQVNVEFGPRLVSAVLRKLGEFRQAQEINGGNEETFVIDVGKSLAEFDADVWKNPYIESVGTDTQLFLQSFDLQPPGVDLFARLAASRARKEAVFANSCFNEREVRVDVQKQVYNAFSLKFQEFASDHPDQSLSRLFRACIRSIPFEQADVDRFTQVTSIFANGELWHIQRDKLKDEIVRRGDTLIQTDGSPESRWDTQSLMRAVQKFSEYQQAVRNLFRTMQFTVPDQRGIRSSSFTHIFRQMFRRDTRRRSPEEYFAGLVEYIAMRTDASRVWQLARIRQISGIMEFFADKDSFVTHFERNVGAHNPRNMEKRNEIFSAALHDLRRHAVVPDQLINSVQRACSPHLSARQAAQARLDVVNVQYTIRTGQQENNRYIPDLTPEEIDAMTLFTVSITRFCGQRRSVFIRMTRLQQDVFSFVMQYKKCPMIAVRELIFRAGVFGSRDTALTTANKIIDTLKDAQLLVAQNTDDGVIVSLGSPELKKPYNEVPAIVEGITYHDAEVMYQIDNRIVQILEEHFSRNADEIFNDLFVQRLSPSFEVLSQRLRLLVARNFATREGSNFFFVPFTHQLQEPSA